MKAPVFVSMVFFLAAVLPSLAQDLVFTTIRGRVVEVDATQAKLMVSNTTKCVDLTKVPKSTAEFLRKSLHKKVAVKVATKDFCN